MRVIEADGHQRRAADAGRAIGGWRRHHRRAQIGAIEFAVLDGGGGALVGPGGEIVLLRPADAEPGVVGVGELAHRGVAERVGKAVQGHGVQQFDRAVLVPGAKPRQQVRGARHRFHPAGHHDVELARPDELGGERDGVQAGQAHLVEGDRGHGHREAGRDRRLLRIEGVAAAWAAATGIEALYFEDQKRLYTVGVCVN